MMPRGLTIAGSDPIGGAGIQQDLKTFHALGVWGASAITAITVQDTARVHAWHAVEPDDVRAQIDAVLGDVGADAAKTGMLPTAACVVAVAKAVGDHRVSALVVDPVFVATSGDPLIDPEAVEAIRAELFPRAVLVTPNAAEASRLTGLAVTDEASQRDAGRALIEMGARAVLVKGGDIGEHGAAVDVLVFADGDERVLAGQRFEGGPFHGTGCMLSAAITAGLALGYDITRACSSAKAIVSDAISRSVALGKGSRLLEPHPVEG